MKPVKYILTITIILVLLAFLFTIPGCVNASRDEGDKSEGSETSTETVVAEEVTTGGNMVTDIDGNIVVGGDVTFPPEETDVTTGENTSSQPTLPPEETEKTALGEPDNEWALYLINHDHALPEDYTCELKTVYVGSNGKEFQMEKTAADYMVRMIEDAGKHGAPLGITSAFRSIEHQTRNFKNNIKQLQAQGMSYDEAYAETARNIAIPGKSEHNSGLAADILSGEHWALDEGFENTRAFRWLDANAHKYGYILRYPKDKEDITKITYEPWHYRFVGVYHATKIKESGLCLEEYMETIN